MQKLKQITEHPIISSLIATAIIAVFTYFVTMEKLKLWIATLFEYIGIGFSYIFKGILFVLTFEVAIWHILVFFILLIGGLFLYAKWEEKQNSTAEAGTVNTTTAITTTENENRILKILEQNYGRGSISIAQIASRLNTNDIMVVEQIIESLHFNKELLERHDNFINGTTFTLNRRGRDYVVANRDRIT